MRRYLVYLRAVLRHKRFVFEECLKLGVPFWIALLHDWDKFLPDEFIPYARCFYKPDGSSQYVESTAFAGAWMLHQHRNKHHWQYWLKTCNIPLPETNVLVWDRGNSSLVVGYNVYDWDDVVSVREPMPDVYRREMLADWRGAGRAYWNEEKEGRPWSPDETKTWYLERRDMFTRFLHPETRAWVDMQLGVIL
jgi:hypothetical protein